MLLMSFIQWSALIVNINILGLPLLLNNVSKDRCGTARQILILLLNKFYCQKILLFQLLYIYIYIYIYINVCMYYVCICIDMQIYQKIRLSRPVLRTEIARTRKSFQHPLQTKKPAIMTENAETTIPPNHHKALTLSRSKIKW